MLIIVWSENDANKDVKDESILNYIYENTYLMIWSLLYKFTFFYSYTIMLLMLINNSTSNYKYVLLIINYLYKYII